MIKEHDCVVLTTDLMDQHLKTGDVGVVVHVLPGRKFFEVEFMTLRGRTITVIELDRTQIRRVSDKEVAHVRELTKA